MFLCVGIIELNTNGEGRELRDVGAPFDLIPLADYNPDNSDDMTLWRDRELNHGRLAMEWFGVLSWLNMPPALTCYSTGSLPSLHSDGLWTCYLSQSRKYFPWIPAYDDPPCDLPCITRIMEPSFGQYPAALIFVYRSFLLQD